MKGNKQRGSYRKTSLISGLLMHDLVQKTEKECRGIRHKPVPWWTTRLTIMRREVNAERRRYQRTKMNEELRRQRRENI